MELRNFLWEAFLQTGDIEAYLLYKESCISDFDEERDNGKH